MKIRKNFLGSTITYKIDSARKRVSVLIEDTDEFHALAKEMGWDYVYVKERKKKEEVADEPEADQEGND